MDTGNEKFLFFYNSFQKCVQKTTFEADKPYFMMPYSISFDLGLHIYFHLVFLMTNLMDAWICLMTYVSSKLFINLFYIPVGVWSGGHFQLTSITPIILRVFRKMYVCGVDVREQLKEDVAKAEKKLGRKLSSLAVWRDIIKYRLDSRQVRTVMHELIVLWMDTALVHCNFLCG